MAAGKLFVAAAALLGVVALFNAGSDDSEATEAGVEASSPAYALDTEEEESSGGDIASDHDEDEEKGGETYAEYDARRDALATGLYSGGDECTEDCGGHDAGREWAERRGVTDPSDCGGKSWSFEEGCRSYAEEQQSAEEDAEAEY